MIQQEGHEKSKTQLYIIVQNVGILHDFPKSIKNIYLRHCRYHYFHPGITLPWQASVKLLLLTQSLLSWIRLKPNLRSPQVHSDVVKPNISELQGNHNFWTWKATNTTNHQTSWLSMFNFRMSCPFMFRLEYNSCFELTLSGSTSCISHTSRNSTLMPACLARSCLFLFGYLYKTYNLWRQ